MPILHPVFTELGAREDRQLGIGVWQWLRALHAAHVISNTVSLALLYKYNYRSMLVTLDRFSAFLQTLGLTQGTYKPTPVTVGHTGINVTSTQSVELSFSSPGAPGTAFGNNFLAKPDFSAQIMDYAGPSCYVAPYDSLEPFTETFPPFDQTKANIYRYRRQQSVNLGSW